MAVKFTLKTASENNGISIDCDQFERTLSVYGGKHKPLGGNNIYNAIGIHYDFVLFWEYLSADDYELLRALYYSGEILYLDDSNVPPLTETAIYPDAESLTFSGITKPADPDTEHAAYYDTASKGLVGLSPGSIDDDEFTTVEYQAIDGDDSNYKESAITDSGASVTHLFSFFLTVARADVNKVAIKITAMGVDGTPLGLNGCKLWYYSGTTGKFQELTSTTDAAKNDLEYITNDENVARELIRTYDDKIHIVVSSRSDFDIADSEWETVAEQPAAGDENIHVIYEFDGSIMGGSDDDNLYKFTGSSWSLVGTADSDILSMIRFDDGGGLDLYVATRSGKLFIWNGTDTLTEVAGVLDGRTEMVDLIVYDDDGGDELYGLIWATGHLFRFINGNAWEEASGATGEGGEALEEYDGYIYAAAGRTLQRWDKSSAWDEMASGMTVDMLSLVIHDRDLFIGGKTGHLYKFDGVSAVTQMAVRVPGTPEIYSMVSHEGWLYAVTAGDSFGPQLFRWNGIDTEISGWITDCPQFGDDADAMSCIVFDSEIYTAVGWSDSPQSNNDARLLKRKYNGSGPSYMRTYYAEAIINNNIIELTHTPILDSGDVIWVKNLTQKTTLALTTHYTISSREITITHQFAGDVIEVKYNRYHQVKFTNLPEDWLDGDPSSPRNRNARIFLTTINTGIEDS